MQITHVKINNVLGIEELEFSPGGFTKISGRNGTGKTSVLEAIKSVIKSGHDATLLRTGAKQGEIVLVLDDGSSLRKRITETGSTTDLIRDGKKTSRPVEAIKALTDMLSVNPVAFLTAEPKDRVRVLLESMPLEVDTARLSTITGKPVKARPGVHALHIIDDIRKQVYDDRTGTNRAMAEKTGTINQLRQALPPDAQAQGDEAGLQEKLDELDAALDKEKTRIADKLSGLRETRDIAIQAKRDEIAKLQEEIGNLQGEFNRVEGLAGNQRQKVIEKHLADTTPVKSALQRIRDDREAYARRLQTLDIIANTETELEGLEAEALAQTDALDAIDAYKLELLNSLPIPGLEVRDGDLFCDNVPFDRLNTARQVDVAVEIAKVRAGELGVICVDRIEALDPQTMDAFRARAAASDLQLFVTRVDGGDFSIET